MLKDKKRKQEEGNSGGTASPKTKCLDAQAKMVATVDLLVMNLPFQLEEKAMKRYFKTFGELLMVQLMKDLEGGFCVFSRMLRHSTTHFVGPSVGPSVGLTIRPSHFTFLGVFAIFGLTAPAQVIK